MYAPLQFLEQCDKQIEELGKQTNQPAGHSLSFLYNFTDKPPYLADEELFRLACRVDFLSSLYNGPFKEIHDLITSPQVINALLYGVGKQTIDEQFRTDVKDFLLIQPVLNIWKKNKQVYKFDKEFAKILIGTEKLKLYKDILEHLPFSTFYIDLSELQIPNVYGQFVSVYRNYDEDTFTIIVYVLAEADNTGLLLYSHYSTVHFQDDSFDVEKPENLKYSNRYLTNSEEDFMNNTMVKTNASLDEIDRISLSMLALQFLMYIGSHEPDIEESLISKQTYKPPVSKPKNSFKEVRTWDVGVKYGNTIRIIQKEIKRKSTSFIKNDETQKRKGPKPHMRCAHWQRYHVGEGRTQTIVKWIPPVMVLGTEEMPITIHTVK